MTGPVQSQQSDRPSPVTYRQGWESALVGEPPRSCGVEGCTLCAAWNEGHADALAERLKDPPAMTGTQERHDG